MSAAELKFEKLHTVFQSETDDAVRYAYSLLGLYGSIPREPNLTKAMNENAIFWGIVLNALTGSTVVTLGRIFDDDSRSYGISRLLNHCTKRISIFSKSSFEARQRAQLHLYAESVVDTRIASQYVPQPKDFDAIADQVEPFKAYYKKEIQPLRHKLHAHRGVACESEIRKLPTTAIEPVRLRECVLFLKALRVALYGLYHEGSAPLICYQNVPATHMLDPTYKSADPWPLEAWVVADVRRVLSSISS